MSYTRDRDAASRGVGAIASRDHAQPSRRAWEQSRMLAATRRRDHAMAQVARGALGLVPDPNRTPPGRAVMDHRPAPAASTSSKVKTVITTRPDGTQVRDHRGAATASGVPNILGTLLGSTLKGLTAVTPPGTIPAPIPTAPPGPSPVIGPITPPAAGVTPAPPATAAPPSTTGGSGGGGVMTSPPPPIPITAPPITLPDIPDVTDVPAPPAAPALDQRTLLIAGGIAAAVGAYFLFRKRGTP